MSCAVKTERGRPQAMNQADARMKLDHRDFTKLRLAQRMNALAVLSAMCFALVAGASFLEQRVEAAILDAHERPLAVPVAEPAPETRAPSDMDRLAEAQAMLAEAPERAIPLLETLFREATSYEVLRTVAVHLVTHAPGFPDGSQGDFLHELAPSVLLAARESSVPPSVTLAQAILESGWGRSAVAREANNLFGMKASRAEPGYAPNGGSRYKVYASWEDSLRAHNELLATSPRYAAARPHADDWGAFLRAIAPVYAASRSYVRLISDLVVRYDLDRWDGLVRDARLAAEAGEEEEPAAAVASVVPAVTER